MKNLILAIVSLFLVSSLSAQKLAKDPHHKTTPTIIDQMSIPAFRAYSVNVAMQLDTNDHKLSDLRFFVINLQQGFNKKAASTVIALQKENDELKSELNDFAKYGLGDWREFQKEFNQDLKSLSADIDYMHVKFMKDYLLTGR